ncbi:MAG: response regulator [Planctomycetes bacterium]|nr:response regulator [Planctomycetota bacterium]
MTAPGKNVYVWTAAGAVMALIVPIIGALIVGALVPGFVWIHVPLRSLLEAMGGMIALAIAGILLAEFGGRKKVHSSWMAAALVNMGLLDLFDAASVPSDLCIWLHGISTLTGGLLFAGVCTSRFCPVFFTRLRFPGAVAAVSILMGFAAIQYPYLLPIMKSSDGMFSTLSVILNLIGGFGFLLASAWFIRRFLTEGAQEDWTFGMLTCLFGAAGVLFGYSLPWDGVWWWWHALRLAAYAVALSYGWRTFRDAELQLRRVNRELSESNLVLQRDRVLLEANEHSQKLAEENLQRLNRQLNDANAALDRTVAERTARLLAVEERFELAVRGSTDGLWDWNVLSGEVYYSARLKELLGYQDDEFPNHFSTFEAHLHPDDRDWVMREVESHLKQRTPYDVEYRLRTNSGDFRWYRARGQAIWNAAGQAQRMAGSITDVTEEHRLRERFRLAVEASPTALMMVQFDGRIVMANSRSLTLFGYSAAELIGQTIDIIVPDEFRSRFPMYRDQYFQAPRPRVMGTDQNVMGKRKDGSVFPAEIGLSPVETAEGPAVICGIMDITSQRQTLEVMRQAKEAAESASRAKSSFLANMSHEIRTPMNGIIGMSQLLAQTELRSHQREYLATVEESAHILLRLLNDILDFSKIEAGRLELECVEFRISECIARAAQMLLLRAAEKGLEIACRIAPEIPDHLLGDPGRIQQILVNLLGNAVKFTETGEIFVNVIAESISSTRVRLRFAVSDTGIGIPSDKLEQIFRPFEQAESSTTRRFGGTGLGLTISRQLVEMMQGRIWVESEFGRGSTFHFTAEFDVAADQQLHTPIELDSLKDLPVLVVDDNLTNRQILCEMMQYWKMRPISAASAEAARQALHSADVAQKPIRLILLDHHMPVEDGFHFVESIRSLQSRQQCPIIMISSGSTPFDTELCQKHGIDRFMTKPVIASELLNEVLHQFSRYRKVTPAPRSHDNSQIQQHRVLLVEDNEINRRVAVGLLRTRGHQVVVAENGQEAVDKLSELEFDVVLMDMQMPVMDGYEATLEIRRREHLAGGHIPIVAMTAEALKGDRERCLEAGMDDYVAKPIVPAELYRAVERFPALCLSAATTESANQPPDSRHEQIVQSTLPQNSQVADPPVIDWAIAQQRLGGGASVIQEFAAIMQEQVPKLMAEIRHAIETRDSQLLRRTAHTIKGSATYFGAEPLVQAAMSLENLGRDGLFEDTATLLERLETEVDHVLNALESGFPAAD